RCTQPRARPSARRTGAARRWRPAGSPRGRASRSCRPPPPVGRPEPATRTRDLVGPVPCRSVGSLLPQYRTLGLSTAPPVGPGSTLLAQPVRLVRQSTAEAVPTVSDDRPVECGGAYAGVCGVVSHADELPPKPGDANTALLAFPQTS